MEVAEKSANRQAKVSACELLHSITLYIIGRSAQMENIRTAQPVAPLYRKLFPTILRLACDVDEVKGVFIVQCSTHCNVLTQQFSTAG